MALREDYEVRYWTEKFGVSKDRLRKRSRQRQQLARSRATSEELRRKAFMCL
ncbi:DUF3606 domain-containing protein [Sphingobium sp. CR28]|uniref:DUF3606 domain-containing protein n=1 Tax=Sphingobium sp. CR28 TaxID=3400272 RepID=UPI003FED830D